jgi:hypothetical protein
MQQPGRAKLGESWWCPGEDLLFSSGAIPLLMDGVGGYYIIMIGDTRYTIQQLYVWMDGWMEGWMDG